MKAATVSKLQQAAIDVQCRLIYFDQAGFSALPSVQRGRSPRDKSHCRRLVPGALDFGAHTLIHDKAIGQPPDGRSIPGDRVAQQTDRRPTVVVLNNASIYHDIDHKTIACWFIAHRMMLFCRRSAVPN
jgi:hypothetical protein